MKYLSWVGTASSIAGSFIVAMQFFLPGYCFFLLGSVSWCIVAAKRADRALLTLNGTFVLANLLGVYNVLQSGIHF